MIFGFGSSGGASSGAAGNTIGNGLVSRNGTQETAVEIRGIGVMDVQHGNGLTDHPLVIFRGHDLGQLRDVDLTRLGDQPIYMKPLWFCLTSISIELPTGLPAEASGGFFTLPDGGGDNLANVTAEQLATLTSKHKILDIPIALPLENRSVQWIYWRGATANVKPAWVNIFMRGRISVDNEEVETVV